MKKNDNKGFKQLNQKQLSQLKGGYRQIPGTVAATNSFRWDEVALRFNDTDSSFGSSDPRVTLPTDTTNTDRRKDVFTQIN
jgi:hypothetical protein